MLSHLRIVIALWSLSPLAVRLVAQARPDSAAPVVQDAALEARTREVAATLRCPVCQNLSIQDSPSQLAQDMKRLVRERLARGETPDEVRRYFVSRYGEWVLLKPKAAGVNLSVWLLPVVALLGGAAIVWVAVGRWVRQGSTTVAAPSPVPTAPPDMADLRSRRAALQASLRDLESELAAGRLTLTDFEFLRQRDQAELATVNESLKRLRKSDAAMEQRPEPTPRPATVPAHRFPPALGWGVGLAAFGVVAALSLKGSISARAPGSTITGGQSGAVSIPIAAGDAGPLDSLRTTQLEARVRRDSTDEPALIELGHLYLTQGRIPEAAQVNMKAVQLQPDAEGTAEAFAHLGMILWSTGETDGALKSIDKALFLHPDLPEALLYKGIILFQGVRDMPRAAEVLQRYLDVAPPSANTARVKGLLEAARNNR